MDKWKFTEHKQVKLISTYKLVLNDELNENVLSIKHFFHLHRLALKKNSESVRFVILRKVRYRLFIFFFFLHY